MMRSPILDYATQTSKGTKAPGADWDFLVKYSVAIPSEPIFSHFSGFVEDVVAHIHNAILRNGNLRRTRDLLLSRLVSGQIDVSDLPIAIPSPP